MAGLLLGAATTVAVAWHDAAEPPQPVEGMVDWNIYGLTTRDHLYTFSFDSEYQRWKHARTVWVDASLHTSQSKPWVRAPAPGAPVRLRDAIDRADERPPSWTVFPTPPDDTAMRRYATTLAAGRPCLALRSYSVTTLEVGEPYLTEGFWQIEIDIDRTLPCFPIFPGFMYDSLFYAALWWPLLVAPGAVKRWRRHRRGRCIGCGYDLAGLAVENGARTCPECGGVSRCRLPA